MNSCQSIQHSQQRVESTKKADLTLVDKVTSISSTQPMDIDNTTASDTILSPNPVKDDSMIKKKKKKTSYKAMMAAMTSSDVPRDIEKEKEAIRKATGGGAFSKIDKI
jgi:hypothetical protein